MTLVLVKPLPIKKWHGKTGEDSFTQPKTIEVLFDPKTGRYATGLTEEQQKEYSERMKVDLTDTYIYETPHPYYSSKAGSIKLADETTVFNTAIATEFVKVANLKASNKVANSLKEWEDGLWPQAHHYIYSEEEEVAVKASKIQVRNRITSRLEKLDTRSKINLILILSGKLLSANNINFIDVELDKIIDEDPDELIRYMKQDPTTVYNRATVLEAIQKHVLTKEGGSIYYMGEIYAETLDLAIERFSDPNNQLMKASILDKINSK